MKQKDSIFKKYTKFVFYLFIISFIISLIIPNSNRGNVAIIPIEGMITYSQSTLTNNVANADIILENIRDASEDAKAIIFLINSPGGTVVASHEITEKIRTLNIPTVSVIRDIGTSGAYWIASSTDYIFADPMSLTASIGATSSYLSFEGTLEKFNITYNRILSGKFKDIGTPFKKLTINEKEKLNSMVNEVNNYFIEEVSANRNLSIRKVREIATGEPILGKKAKDLGLIDRFGTLDNAKEYLKKELNEDVKTYKYKMKESLIEEILSLSKFRIDNNIGLMAK